MSFNFYDTHNLLMAINGAVKPASFLRDRYAPTVDARDIFATNDVLVEYKDGTNKMAPFVAPRKGGVTMLRQGASMKVYTPANIAPRRILTLDDLKKRGFGEALYSQLTPAQREQVMITGDMVELSEFITRREEWMVAQLMLTNGCVMKHIADDATEGDEAEVRYYDGETNPAAYTPAKSWADADADIIGDLEAMARLLTRRGLPATELVVSPDVSAAIINNEKIQKLLDNRRYELGNVAPEALPAGATRVCSLNVNGRRIDVICYDEVYTDDDGTVKQYITEGHAVLTAPAAARMVYGAVSQVEQADGAFHTYAAKRVPKYLANADGNTRSVTVTSCPLPVPNNKNPFIVANVMG